MHVCKKKKKLVHRILCNMKKHISVSINLSSQLTIVMVKQKAIFWLLLTCILSFIHVYFLDNIICIMLVCTCTDKYHGNYHKLL